MKNRPQHPKDQIIINERIRHKLVRVSNPGSESEIMSIDAAIELAFSQDLDLILINENASPPICRILDLNKYMYEQKQREKEAKKKQRESVVDQKEIRMGLNIDTNDLQTKANHAKKFIKERAKVTVSIVLKGRERGKQDMAVELLKEFIDLVGAEYENINSQGNKVIGRIK